MRRAWAGLSYLALPVFAAVAEPDYATLADAAMNRDADAVRALLAAGADVNALGTYGTPALHWLVRVEDRASVGALLDAGADPNLRSAQGVAPLHLALANRDVGTVGLLLAAGADATLADHAGETPLMLAARHGDAKSVARLLAAGAPVDAREAEYGQTALVSGFAHVIQTAEERVWFAPAEASSP